MRLDKWLWAARFFKTRSLAAAAVDGGRVKVNGVAVKPAKEIRLADRLQIRQGEHLWEGQVKGLSERRGPPAEAQGLYEESVESMARRVRISELCRLAPAPATGGRPTKRDRRQLNRLHQA